MRRKTAKGLNKLADKIMAESDEEWDEAKKVNARLIEEFIIDVELQYITGRQAQITSGGFSIAFDPLDANILLKETVR